MDLSEALNILQNECDNLPSGQQKTDLQTAIDVLSDSSSVITKPQAMDILNDTYWDVELEEKCNFSSATNYIGCTVDPNRPMPEVRV